MKIVQVEPTPSPNSMKLTLDERLNPGVRLSYDRNSRDAAPQLLRRLLDIPGVAAVFHTADFIALDRHPKGDWPSILAAAKETLGVAEGGANAAGTGNVAADSAEEASGYGEVNVLVQTFRSIPMQVRVLAGTEERRAALPERFLQAATEAGLASPNLIKERKLEDRGVRYGELADVLDEVVRELDAAFDDTRLRELVTQSFALGSGQQTGPAAPGNGQADASTAPEGQARPQRQQDLAAAALALRDPDWRKRYAALERLAPGPDMLPLLVSALGDEQTSMRRLAVVYIGDIREPDTLPYLLQALRDPSPVIRRTAGDCLSDRGDPAAAKAMAQALGDGSKLVRWRAARFLYEIGDESALEALRLAKDDPEFEVRLQVRMAIERIEGGGAAQGTVWQQMARRRDEP